MEIAKTADWTLNIYGKNRKKEKTGIILLIITSDKLVCACITQ